MFVKNGGMKNIIKIVKNRELRLFVVPLNYSMHTTHGHVIGS
jgi:hypothetical protein